MVRVWVAGKTVWSSCYARAISERFKDKGLIIKRYINSPVYCLLTFAVIAVTADFQACIEDGTVLQIVRQHTLAATTALTLA